MTVRPHGRWSSCPCALAVDVVAWTRARSGGDASTGCGAMPASALLLARARSTAGADGRVGVRRGGGVATAARRGGRTTGRRRRHFAARDGRRRWERDVRTSRSRQHHDRQGEPGSKRRHGACSAAGDACLESISIQLGGEVLMSSAPGPGRRRHDGEPNAASARRRRHEKTNTGLHAGVGRERHEPGSRRSHQRTHMKSTSVRRTPPPHPMAKDGGEAQR